MMRVVVVRLGVIRNHYYWHLVYRMGDLDDDLFRRRILITFPLQPYNHLEYNLVS